MPLTLLLFWEDLHERVALSQPTSHTTGTLFFPPHKHTFALRRHLTPSCFCQIRTTFQSITWTVTKKIFSNRCALRNHYAMHQLTMKSQHLPHQESFSSSRTHRRVGRFSRTLRPWKNAMATSLTQSKVEMTAGISITSAVSGSLPVFVLLELASCRRTKISTLASSQPKTYYTGTRKAEKASSSPGKLTNSAKSC